MFLTIFRKFPTIFRRFPKILKMLSEGQKNGSEHFPNFSENFRRLPKIAEEDPKMFRLNINFLAHSALKQGKLARKCFEIDIFTCENNTLFSRVKIWFFRAKDFLVFHCLYNKIKYNWREIK